MNIILLAILALIIGGIILVAAGIGLVFWGLSLRKKDAKHLPIVYGNQAVKPPSEQVWAIPAQRPVGLNYLPIAAESPIIWVDDILDSEIIGDDE